MRSITPISVLAIIFFTCASAAISQNQNEPDIAVQCNISNADNAPEFADAFCDFILDAAYSRWSWANVSEFSEEITYDILISIDVNIPHQSAAIYQLSWGDPQSWLDGNIETSEQMSIRKPNAHLNRFMAQRIARRIFAPVDIDF